MISVVYGPSSYYTRNFNGDDALERALKFAKTVKPATKDWDGDVTIYEVDRGGGTDGYYREDGTFVELG